MSDMLRLAAVGQEHVKAVHALFAIIQNDAKAKLFHPHPFTAVEANTRCAYSGNDFYGLLFAGETVVGYGLLRGWDAGYSIPSLGIYLTPEARGKGLGKPFMQLLHKEAKYRGAASVRLKVYASNLAALGLYQSLGYIFDKKEDEQLVGHISLSNADAGERVVAAATGFTVVVPSYNQGQFIDHTLTSLLDQNYPDLEIIVMDGGSTDDTVERLKTYGDKIQWTSQKDGGQTDALIKGFAKATKPWLTWLNSDDFQLNNALHLVAAAIKANPSVEVVMGNGHYANPDGTFLRAYPRVECGPNVDMKHEFFRAGYVAQPSVYFRKDAYQRVGGLNPHKNLCMDYDLWTRLAVGGCQFVAIEEDISGNRWYEDTKTSQQLGKLYGEVVDTQLQHFGKVAPFFVQAMSDHVYASLTAKPEKKEAPAATQAAAPVAAKPSLARRLLPKGALLARWLLFKLTAVRLMWRKPMQLATFLRGKNFKRGGALANDPMGFMDILKG